jgi:hypothetical protein
MSTLLKWLSAIALALASAASVAPAARAQTLVKPSAAGAQNATSVSSAAFAPAASDIVAAACLNDTSGVTATLSDSQGNSFTAFPVYADPPWSGVWAYAPAKAGADTLKCTLSGKATFAAIFAVDVRGATAVSTFANASGASSAPSVSAKTTVAGTLIAAAVFDSAHVSSGSGSTFTSDGFGNALATLAVPTPTSATLSFTPSNTKWMEVAIAFTGTAVVTPTPPVVTLAAPPYSGTVTLIAAVTDANSSITSVQFLLDGVALGSPLTSPPYSFTWNTTGTTNAAHSLAATATNAAGQSTTSAPVSVTVSNAASASPMTILSPITLPQGTTQTSYSVALSTLNQLSGGVPPYTYALVSGALPAGLSLSSAGVLAGTPTVVGDSTFSYSVTDASGQAVTVTLKIVAKDERDGFKCVGSDGQNEVLVPCPGYVEVH